MIGLIFILLATFLEETASSIGKFQVGIKKESIYTAGFLMLLWGALFLVIIAFIRDSFTFSIASLPTLSIRIILEVVQAHVTILAITRADRSTFGFLRIITIPLLLATDVFLGYAITLNEMAGIGIIVAALIFLFINHGLKKEGAWFVAFSSVNAVVTISLFKYNISHFNSVEVEQGIVNLILVAYFFVMATFIAKEKPFQFLRKPIFLAQSLAAGVATVLMSFAYLFAAASIITTAKRAGSVIWAIVAGSMYFKEKKLIVKLVSLCLILGGLILLAV